MDRCSMTPVYALLDRELTPDETIEVSAHVKECRICSTRYRDEQDFRTWFREEFIPTGAPHALADQIRLRLESEERPVFVIKINGKPAAITNTFDSAVSYLDGLQCSPRAATITTLDWGNFGPELAAIQQDGDRQTEPKPHVTRLPADIGLDLV